MIIKILLLPITLLINLAKLILSTTTGTIGFLLSRVFGTIFGAIKGLLLGFGSIFGGNKQ